MSMLEVIFVLHKNESKMYVLNYEKGAYLSEISHIPPKLPHFFPVAIVSININSHNVKGF